MDFSSKNVQYLKDFLRSRQVSFSNQRKQDLLDLCKAADDLQLEIDPEGILENKSDVIAKKLKLADGTNVTLPTLLETTNDFSNIPRITEYDITLHMSRRQNVALPTLRDPKKMEGFGLFVDGYVLDLQATPYSNSPYYSAVIGHVKPRTNAKDPTTGLPHYVTWIILCSDDNQERIHSAFCTCRGG